MKVTNNITVVKNHDYLSLRTPNGNYTLSHNGSKTTGLLIEFHDKIEQFVNDHLEKGGNFGTAFDALATEQTLTALCPGWDKPVPVFKVGQFVKVINPTFTKKYPLQGRVIEVKKKYVFVQFPCEGSAIGMEPQWLEAVSNEKTTTKSEENPVNPRISKDEIARLKQLAIDSTPSSNPPSRLDQVKAAITAGYTGPTAIAKFTGIHPSYVSTLLKKI